MSDTNTDRNTGATMTRIADDEHERLHAHKRDGETLSGTIGRALDALEREAALPEAVREAMGDE